MEKSRVENIHISFLKEKQRQRDFQEKPPKLQVPKVITYYYTFVIIYILYILHSLIA